MVTFLFKGLPLLHLLHLHFVNLIVVGLLQLLYDGIVRRHGRDLVQDIGLLT
jgi:hypothetical protein